VPTLTVIAGPNGSGKSTLTRFVDFEGRERLLDSDAIARRLNPIRPSEAAISAGKELLRRESAYLNLGVSFAIETTLAGSGGLRLFCKAKSRGYEIHLIYIGLDSPERCVTRIRNRVALGGHQVPDAAVRRRYARSLENAHQALRLADIAKFYDNSGNRAHLVLVAKSGAIV
jgi:predicted ABC-type ATPase